MDKYEFNIKVEQIKKLVNKEDYETSMKMADTIDWRRVRNTNLLSMVAMIYEKNKEYREAKEILLQAYERAPIGKRLLYKLAEMALKEGNVEEAEAYYREFSILAPEDSRQHLLRYMILRAKGAPTQQLIHSLEAYTNIELDEKWLYELAELYSFADMSDRCVETCDRIMLMFGIGIYVDKARNLKVKYAPLTHYQMDLVENRDKYEARLRAVEKQYREGIEPKQPVYEEIPELELEPEVESEPVPEPEFPKEVDPDISIENVSVQEVVIEEVAAQETLAKELSNISYYEPSIHEEIKLESTRVMEDIKRIARPVLEEDELEVQVEEQTAATFSDRLEFEDLYDEEEDDEDDEEDEEDIPVKNHLMIEAITPEKGLSMAVEVLKQIHKENGVTHPVAKITGSKLSRRGVMACAEKLAGKDLFIEEAGDLTLEAINELNEIMNHNTSGTIVILLDVPDKLEMLHKNYPEFSSQFECIGSDKEEPYEPQRKREEEPVSYDQEEEMGIDEFAQYACRYASQIDCSITGKSMLALYERIEIMEEEGIPLRREAAENLIEEAADRAEKPSIGRRMKNMFSSKYDKDGLLVLKEEHFIY